MNCRNQLSPGCRVQPLVAVRLCHHAKAGAGLAPLGSLSDGLASIARHSGHISYVTSVPGWAQPRQLHPMPAARCHGENMGAATFHRDLPGWGRTKTNKRNILSNTPVDYRKKIEKDTSGKAAPMPLVVFSFS